MLLEVKWLLGQEHIHDVWGITELKGLAGLLWSVDVDQFWGSVLGVDLGLEGWVELIKLFKLVVFVLVGVLDGSLAHLTDVVLLSVEFVNLGGGESDKGGNSERSH